MKKDSTYNLNCNECEYKSICDEHGVMCEENKPEKIKRKKDKKTEEE